MNLSGGIRLEGYGFELTLGPNLSWSQNKYYKIMDNSAYYTNIYAYIWGFGNNKGADAPQRFGESSFWTFDWGDSEIRWSWYGLTFGFGTQSIIKSNSGNSTKKSLKANVREIFNERRIYNTITNRIQTCKNILI